MRHQAEHVAFPATDAGNIVPRAVWISGVGYLPIFVAIAKHDTIFTLELGEGQVVADIIPFGMRNGNAQHTRGAQFVRERRVRSLYTNKHMLADEVQIAVAN